MIKKINNLPFGHQKLPTVLLPGAFDSFPQCQVDQRYGWSKDLIYLLLYFLNYARLMQNFADWKTALFFIN